MTQRSKRPSVRLFGLLTLVLLSFGAGACNSYSYYDLDLKFGTGFDFGKISSIYSCHLIVSGAANDDITLDPAQCRVSTSGDFGMVEYSTFADSGNITFTFTASASTTCKLGDGSTTLPAGMAVRRTGTVTATSTTSCP